MKTLTQTQTTAEPNLQDTVWEPNNIPPITLPFDEWPQVFKDFNTDVPNMSAGQCPTVSFTIGILNNTTFTFASQCLVMNALKPYLAYVLPPTYLFMALLFLMAA